MPTEFGVRWRCSDGREFTAAGYTEEAARRMLEKTGGREWGPRVVGVMRRECNRMGASRGEEAVSYRYRSADGLVASNDPAVIQTWDRIGDERASQQQEASARLRAQGVKAEHPDDGWVNRQRNYVQLVYPAFNDGPDVGDLIALGWPWRGYRLVRCTQVEHHRGPLLRTIRYYFVPLAADLPVGEG